MSSLAQYAWLTVVCRLVDTGRNASLSLTFPEPGCYDCKLFNFRFYFSPDTL